jgi:hypothetical protein
MRPEGLRSNAPPGTRTPSPTFGARDFLDPAPSPSDWTEESPTFGGLRFGHLCIRSVALTLEA